MKMIAPNPAPSVERDPVCGMNVNPATAKHVYEHAGKKYYFCCAQCAEKFKAAPQGYLTKPATGLVTLGTAAEKPAPHATATVMPPAKPVVQKTIEEPAPSPSKGPVSDVRSYVCPMCSEVRESKPGACPSCGMALEVEFPVAATRTEYTCPMHPQIVRSELGSCPICGMAL